MLLPLSLLALVPLVTASMERVVTTHLVPSVVTVTDLFGNPQVVAVRPAAPTSEVTSVVVSTETKILTATLWVTPTAAAPPSVVTETKVLTATLWVNPSSSAASKAESSSSSSSPTPRKIITRTRSSGPEHRHSTNDVAPPSASIVAANNNNNKVWPTWGPEDKKVRRAPAPALTLGVNWKMTTLGLGLSSGTRTRTGGGGGGPPLTLSFGWPGPGAEMTTITVPPRKLPAVPTAAAVRVVAVPVPAGEEEGAVETSSSTTSTTILAPADGGALSPRDPKDYDPAKYTLITGTRKPPTPTPFSTFGPPITLDGPSLAMTTLVGTRTRMGPGAGDDTSGHVEEDKEVQTSRRVALTVTTTVTPSSFLSSSFSSSVSSVSSSSFTTATATTEKENEAVVGTTGLPPLDPLKELREAGFSDEAIEELVKKWKEQHEMPATKGKPDLPLPVKGDTTKGTKEGGRKLPLVTRHHHNLKQKQKQKRAAAAAAAAGLGLPPLDPLKELKGLGLSEEEMRGLVEKWKEEH